jgi:hypothetical protein
MNSQKKFSILFCCMGSISGANFTLDFQQLANDCH